MTELTYPIKPLQEYEVYVTLPSRYRFKGAVPFDFTSKGDNTAMVVVYAENDIKAQTIAQEYFDGLAT
jgi:hypothetical protein